MLINRKVFHIHIPRTGGRFVKELFLLNNYLVEHFEFDKTFNFKDVGHLTFPDHDIYFGHMICKKFAIVRDPVDRFLSAIKSDSKLNQETIDYIFTNEQNFKNFVSTTIFNDSCNWYTPQINFLDFETKIYKYENGLDNNFSKWLLDNFEFDIIMKDYVHTDRKRNIELNEKQKNFVKNYYFKDYKLLDY